MQVGATQSLKWWLPLEIWQHTLSVLAEHVSAASPAPCPGTNLQATVSSVCNLPVQSALTCNYRPHHIWLQKQFCLISCTALPLGKRPVHCPLTCRLTCAM